MKSERFSLVNLLNALRRWKKKTENTIPIVSLNVWNGDMYVYYYFFLFFIFICVIANFHLFSMDYFKSVGKRHLCNESKLSIADEQKQFTHIIIHIRTHHTHAHTYTATLPPPKSIVYILTCVKLRISIQFKIIYC